MTVWRPSTRSAENSLRHSSGLKCAKHSPRNGQSVSVLRQRAVRTRALSFAKQSSMGLRSGLEGGTYQRVAPAAWRARWMPATVWAPRVVGDDDVAGVLPWCTTRDLGQ